MDGQVGHFQRMIKELNEEKETVKLVFVDWSSAHQQKNSGKPVREACDFPVLQSPFWSEPDSLQNTWLKALREVRGDEVKQPKSFAWSDMLFALDSSGKVTGVFEFKPPHSRKRSLGDPETYKQVKELIVKAANSE